MSAALLQRCHSSHFGDKTGAVYYNRCKKHTKSDYIGETNTVFRERLYEHRTINHKTSTRAASIEHTQERDEREQKQSDVRRSKRTMKKRNCKTMHEGTNQQLTEGNTEFSAHAASDEHQKEGFEYPIIYNEENWFKRGIKEAIAIRKMRPTLNLDEVVGGICI